MHNLVPYLKNPQHRITISLVGAGGTGSNMLTNLAIINYTLEKMDRTGLHVKVFDNERIDENNVGRQIFSPADIGEFKAVSLVKKINRFFGTDWIAVPEEVAEHNLLNGEKDFRSNFIISCVDSIKARKVINKRINSHIQVSNNYMNGTSEQILYWLDIGNGHDYGQAILGTAGTLSYHTSLPGNPNIQVKITNFFDHFPNTKDTGKKQPSCSMAMSIGRQDLFVNKLLATFAADMLWQLLKNHKINYHGFYMNLKTFKIKKIPI